MRFGSGRKTKVEELLLERDSVSGSPAISSAEATQFSEGE
jgi:hypothetical protein